MAAILLPKYWRIQDQLQDAHSQPESLFCESKRPKREGCNTPLSESRIGGEGRDLQASQLHNFTINARTKSVTTLFGENRFLGPLRDNTNNDNNRDNTNNDNKKRRRRKIIGIVLLKEGLG